MAHTATFVPNEHLTVDGVPDVPQSLVDEIARFTLFAATDVVAWHPTRRTLLVAHRRRTTPQLHLLDGPMQTLRPLTDFDDPVTHATFEPQRGDYLVYARDTGGDEASQLYRLDLADGRTTQLTDPAMKHGHGVWNHAGTTIAFESLPLDRVAGSRGARLLTLLCIVDPLDPGSRRTIAELPGGGWGGFRWSPDDRTLYALEHRSVTDSRVWAIDVADGSRRCVLPASGRGPNAIAAVDVTRDGRFLVYASDEDGEFRHLMTFDLASGERLCLTRHLPGDVESVVLEGAGGSTHECAAVIVNVAARHTLHLFDLATGDEIALPPWPDGVGAGSVSRVRFAKIADDRGPVIACTVASARTPGDVVTIELATHAVTAWSRATVDGLDTTGWREADVVSIRSFDGREIGALVSRPPTRFTGKRPVLVHIHGGPESQAVIGFLGVAHWFVEELGIAYVQPNVRGSTGYGRTFVSLDDGLLREDAVRDIGALLDWIATQPDLDATRVLVAGRSYGGFMSLAVATTYASRIVASIAIVAISHFTSFLERTETYRRDLRRVEYGDERDPVVRAFFDRISPLSNADRIAKPLLVVAGRNDPRVPFREGERIVEKVKANGVPVWHVVANDEGHVFTRKPNTDYVFYAQALFVRRFLLAIDAQAGL